MNVKIYSTPTCAFCKKTKAFFQENNIEYEEKDVASDTSAAQEMVNISHQMGVPVTVVSNEGNEPEIIIGFDKQRLSAALRIK